MKAYYVTSTVWKHIISFCYFNIAGLILPIKRAKTWTSQISQTHLANKQQNQDLNLRLKKFLNECSPGCKITVGGYLWQTKC